MRALTDFLLREVLTLLLDDPTPRNVAHEMGGVDAQNASAFSMESQTDASEDSESQAAMITTNSHRVMMVRSTNSAQSVVTLVDRRFSVDAFISKELVDQLRVRHRYKSLSRLRGSVIRVEKYHFATPAMQKASTHSRPQRASALSRLAQGEQAKICLVVDALSVVDGSELAVNPLPDLEEHPAVARQLEALSPSALTQRLERRQGLSQTTPAPLTPAKKFDDHNPLLDEDCEIPEDQERELDEQYGWGDFEVAPTDSQLIEENGPVSGSDSQPAFSGNTSSGNTIVSSSEHETPRRPVRVVVSETEPESQMEESVPDSQDYPFQQENLQKAFVECSDTESDGEGGDEHGVEAEDVSVPSSNLMITPRSAEEVASQQVVDLSGRSLDSSGTTQSQSDGDVDEASQLPETQAPDASAPSVHDEQTQASQTSQAPGEFMGIVEHNHDEPMTQQEDETQPNSQYIPFLSGRNDSQQNPVVEPTSAVTNAADDDGDVEYGVPEDHHESCMEDDNEGHAASQQDGQADHWMHTQPSEPSPAKSTQPQATNAESSPTGPNITERRKRKRSQANALAPRPLSPQEPSEKATRPQRPPEPTSITGPAAFPANDRDVVSQDADLLASLGSSAPDDVVHSIRHRSFGISSFSKKSFGSQDTTMRPSKRYQHLLPPFDFAAIQQHIAGKSK